MTCKTALIFLCVSAIVGTSVGLDIEVLAQWNLFEFDIPYDYELISYFRPENTVFTGLEITDDRYFISMPRLRAGVPATVATIPRNIPPGSSPVLRAYPDWSFHSAGKGNNSVDCNGLVSVYRLRTDSCNRLWVLDSGVMTSLDAFTRVCQPKIMIFDLQTDQVVRTIIFPNEVLRPASLLTNLVIDESVQGSCDSAFVYMTDTAAPGIVVYNGAKDAAWRVMHPAMFPDPDFSDYTVDNERFTLMDGIVGFTHSPKLATVFFQPLATDRLFSIPTSALTKGPPAEFEVLPITLVGKKSSQGLGLALDERDESIYFSPLAETSVASYNPVNSRQKLLAYDPALLQFPAELRWYGKDGSIYLLSTRFQKFFRKTVSPNEVNLRIIRIRTNPRVVSGLTNSLYFKK